MAEHYFGQNMNRSPITSMGISTAQVEAVRARRIPRTLPSFNGIVCATSGRMQDTRARRILKGDTKVLAVLNQVLKAELTAINQYFLHAEMCENWGYQKLAKHTRGEAIEEMEHAEKLMERILLLDGMPNMSDYFKINIGQSVKVQIQNDLQVEYDAVKRLNAGIETCVNAGDNGSRDLLEGILTDEEEHIDYLEAQLHAISEIGIENYLAQQLEEKKAGEE